MKKVLCLILTFALMAYTITMAIVLPKLSLERNCTDLIVEINTSDQAPIYTEESIKKHITKSKANPIGQPMSEVNVETIEEMMKTYTIYTDVTVYATATNQVKVILEQRSPICHIMGQYGAFYLDDSGEVFESYMSFDNLMPIATGSIRKEFAKTEIYKLLCIINQDDFWRQEIQQIYVDPKGNIELIPTLGNHTILLGTTQNLEDRLDSLKTFYLEGLNTVGWNRYTSINIKYDGQIVCKKR